MQCSRCEGQKDLQIVVAKWQTIIAVKLDIVERGSDAEPAGHGGGFLATDMRAGGNDHVAPAHWTADQNYFEFNGGATDDLLGAKKKNARRADVARHQSNRKIFSDSRYAAQA